MAQNFNNRRVWGFLVAALVVVGILAAGCGTALKLAGAGRSNPLLYALGETAEQLQWGDGETITTTVTTTTTTAVPALQPATAVYYACNDFTYDSKKRITGAVGKRSKTPLTFTPFEQIIFAGERNNHAGKQSTIVVYTSTNAKIFEETLTIDDNAYIHYAPFEAGLTNGTYRAFFSLDGVQSGYIEILVREPWDGNTR